MMKWWFIMITTFQHWRWPGLRKRKLPPLQLLVAPDNDCYDDDDDAAKFSPPPKQDHIMSLKIMAMMIKLAMVNPDYHWSLITTIMSKPLEIAMISKLMLRIEIEYDGTTTNGMYEMLIKSSPKREPWSMTFDTGNQMKVKKQKKMNMDQTDKNQCSPKWASSETSLLVSNLAVSDHWGNSLETLWGHLHIKHNAAITVIIV